MTHPCPPGFRFHVTTPSRKGDDVERTPGSGLCPNAPSEFADRMRRVFKQYPNPWVGIWTFEVVAGPLTQRRASYYLDDEVWDGDLGRAQQQIEFDTVAVGMRPPDFYKTQLREDVHYESYVGGLDILPSYIVALVPWVAKEVNRALKRGDPGAFDRLRAISSSLPELADWAAAERPDIMRMDFGEAYAASREWHAALAEEAERRSRVAGGGTTIYRWEDGWHADALTTHAELVAEGCAMGHCVGQSEYWRQVKAGSTSIVSMRDARDASRLTLELAWVQRSQRHPRDGLWQLVQVKGFGNRLPKEDECFRINQLATAFGWRVGINWGHGDLENCHYLERFNYSVEGGVTPEKEDVF